VELKAKLVELEAQKAKRAEAAAPGPGSRPARRPAAGQG
jgi:hypothetical protein